MRFEVGEMGSMNAQQAGIHGFLAIVNRRAPSVANRLTPSVRAPSFSGSTDGYCGLESLVEGLISDFDL